MVTIKLRAERWTPRFWTPSGILVYILAFACLCSLKLLLSQVLLVYCNYQGDGGLGRDGDSAAPALVQWASITRYTITRKGIPRV